MSDMSKAEAMKAAREARDRVASAPRTSSTSAVEAAMKRYLSAEQYHELNEETRIAEQERTERAD
ncbi:hypothetical protein [Nocardioides sediminis]|uniref:hypothetical protein n=1 Tax=Nocardioides sediminis TaxID=433648 RepID=UPI000D31BCEA|nr:hypothetical protein [Nocardioides sediminis]